MTTRLFGTDGVRGTAGRPPLDEVTIRRLGGALVRALPGGDGPRRLIIGRDTRESGPWIEREFACGVTSAGGQIVSAGVLPTPAIAYLTRQGAFDAGVVVSASHNPFEDNGIKVFSGAGEKFTETLEREVEAIVADQSWQVPGGAATGVETSDYGRLYLDHLRPALSGREALGPTRLAIDCANGATVAVAPRLFRELGFDLVAIGDSPDGRNINLECGSTRPDRLARTVVDRGCRLGVAFDGDGDRAIFVDHRGQVVDGDAVLLMCARHLRSCGRLRGDAIVATVMSNVGLEMALASSGIRTVRCPVGDKYVMEELIRHDLALGGEQSGHIIFSDLLYTGDGLATALGVLEVMAASGRELADLAGELVTLPQLLVNVRVAERTDLSLVPPLAAELAASEARLSGRGRLLVRYSGTEPLLRIMVEGPDAAEIREIADTLAAAVRVHLA